MNLNLIANVIDKINFDCTINLSDILSASISVLSVIVTIIIAFKTINRNSKIANKQLEQQQYSFQQQLDESRKNHAENKNVELKKNQVECLPIIDIESSHASKTGNYFTFKITLKNKGNGTAIGCKPNADNNLVIYTDNVDSKLEYSQTNMAEFILKKDDNFDITIQSNKVCNGAHKVEFSIIYKDLMEREYKQLFVFHYDYPDNFAPQFTTKYMWKCIKDIEFKA